MKRSGLRPAIYAIVGWIALVSGFAAAVVGAMLKADPKTFPLEYAAAGRFISRVQGNAWYLVPGLAMISGSFVLMRKNISEPWVWSSIGGEVVCVVLPDVGQREIPMETAAANPKLRDIFNKIREADTEAWKWHGEQPPTKAAFVTLSDEEIETLLDRDGPLPSLRRLNARPIQLRHTGDGTKPAA